MIFNFFKPAKSVYTEEVFKSALAQAQKTFPNRFNVETATVEERREKFEGISIFMALYTWYLKEEGSKDATKLSQDSYDHMFDLYEIALREQGVADVRVGPEVKKLAAAFHGRLESYGAAFSEADTAKLTESLIRNHVCDKPKAMGLSIALISEARKMKSQNLKDWISNLKNLQKGIYEPKEYVEENAS